MHDWELGCILLNRFLLCGNDKTENREGQVEERIKAEEQNFSMIKNIKFVIVYPGNRDRRNKASTSIQLY
jgi:hypothetical protein